MQAVEGAAHYGGVDGIRPCARRGARGRPPARLRGGPTAAMLATHTGGMVMGRTILGMVVGTVVMFLTIMGIEAIGHLAYPPPPGLDPTNPEHEAAFARFVLELPAMGKVVLALAWVAGAFTGGLAAAKIARHQNAAAVFVALEVMSGVVAMIVRVPHTTWLAAAGLLLPIPAALLAARLVHRPKLLPKL